LTKQGIEIVTPRGNYPVYQVPEKSMIGEGQFIKIDCNNKFINTFRYYTPHQILFHHYPDSKFGEIKYINGKLFIYFGNNAMQAVTEQTDMIQEGQLVLADPMGRINKFFKKMHFSLDYFYEILKFQGLELWRTINIFNDMCVIENIDTDKKEILDIPENISLKENAIILRKAGEIINTLDFKFYSHSRYYNKAIQGTAEVKDDILMLVKSTGEKVIVNNSINVPDIETGNIITIDEFNNIIRCDKKTYTNNPVVLQKKNLLHCSNKYKVNHLKINKNVVIVGNPTYQQSYKLNLLKNGYQAEIVDGYYSWSRIQKSMKDIDIVVVIINNVSHENMWLIKDNIKEIPVIYSDSDGASRIIEQIDNLYNENAKEG
jgi:hypothetical protein